ncbi:glutathione S-transferase family protein [Yoonia litorea]|uniref:Glutathione S-transferase n=1 Tax=Yoonia litorea TaxID=1123755 RepID=A0A1I6MXD5_9RHOB|nr:glutathione S-transferase family protein [Yoonia litorea]SFS20218.1 glutathione S-transferase [Yoonia litorea]
MLKLHYAPNTVSVATAILLEHIGKDYETIRVDFTKSEQTSYDYLQINPKGRVPALETPSGILTETPAILEYVAPDMVPDDPYAAGTMRELMSYLNGTVHPHHAHKLRGSRWASEEASFEDMRRMVPQRMSDCAAHLEENLPQYPFDAGAFDVVSDPYLYVVLSWMKGDGVQIENYPRLVAFQHRMNTYPSVQAAYEKGML